MLSASVPASQNSLLPSLDSKILKVLVLADRLMAPGDINLIAVC